jgi:hypothetical protein
VFFSSLGCGGVILGLSADCPYSALRKGQPLYFSNGSDTFKIASVANVYAERNTGARVLETTVLQLATHL